MYNPDRATFASAVAVSPCGNYCVVGSKGGVVYRYNAQSGLPRGAFPSNKATGMKASRMKQLQNVPGNVLHEQRQMVLEGVVAPLNPSVTVPNTELSATPLPAGDGGHTGAVTGLFIEATGSVMVSCGMDSLLFFWCFASHRVLQKTELPGPAQFLVGYHDGGLVAVASQDRVVRVYDIL